MSRHRRPKPDPYGLLGHRRVWRLCLAMMEGISCAIQEKRENPDLFGGRYLYEEYEKARIKCEYHLAAYAAIVARVESDRLNLIRQVRNHDHL